jgi:MFS family permease
VSRVRTAHEGRLDLYLEGLRTSVRVNATAYGYSIMITSSFGIVAALAPDPPTWAYFLFALGASAGFPLVLATATKGFRDQSFEAERTDVLVFAAVLNVASVLAGVGAAALVAWPASGWVAWLAAPIAATVAYLVVNGLEYMIAEREEERHEA